MAVTKLSAEYVALSLEPLIRAEVFTQLRLERMIESVVGAQASIGQKRVVSVNQNNKNTVIKLAYNYDGILGNACEYLCYSRLVGLADSGEITNEDLELFAATDLVNNSPFVIQQEFGNEFPNDTDFQRWLADNYPEKEHKPWLYVSEYIFKTPELREDANRIQQILSKYFVASDVHVMQEPKNFAIRYIQNGSRTIRRLMLIDMDSCIPMFEDERGDLIAPVCPVCGGAMVYVPNAMRPGQNIEALQNQSGVYTCLREGCVNDIRPVIETNGYAADNYDIRDNNVFRKYVEEDCAYELMFDVAMMCNIYAPVKTCFTIAEYKKAVIEELGEYVVEFWGDRIFAAFRNYQNILMGQYLAGNSGAILSKTKEFIIDEKMDFVDYANSIAEYIPTRINNDPISMKLIATLYVQGICGEDFITCAEMYNARSAKELADVGREVLTDTDLDNIYDLYKWLYVVE